MLLNYNAQDSVQEQKIIWPKISVVLNLGNSGLNRKILKLEILKDISVTVLIIK